MVRKQAYEILKKVLLEHAYSNLALKQLPLSMSKQDTGLVSSIVYGTLQNYDYCSYQWIDFIDKKCPKRLEILINMSIYQFIFLDRIPDYAIVNESLNCIKTQERGFVQAILSKYLERGEIEVENSDPIKSCSIKYSIPEWILQLWKAHYGEETMIKISQAMIKNDKKQMGRVNPILCDFELLRNDEKVTFLDDWAFEYAGNLLETDYFKSGQVVIQDYSSQQVAKLLNPAKMSKVLDACSAPGTKTSMLAAIMENTGEIYACDLHRHRLDLVDEAMKRLGIKNVKTLEMDSTKLHEYFGTESFDSILLDVPCSGLGTLSHKPDLKYHIQASDLDAIILIQKEILESAWTVLKKGKELVYSTCTLNKKENERQISAFINNHEDAKLVSEKTYFPLAGYQDGFYMAKIIKKI